MAAHGHIRRSNIDDVRRTVLRRSHRVVSGGSWKLFASGDLGRNANRLGFYLANHICNGTNILHLYRPTQKGAKISE